MVKFQNDCCDCATAGYPCLGELCDLRHVPHFWCDVCPDEADELYRVGDLWMCFSCLLKEAEAQGVDADGFEFDYENLIEETMTSRF